MNERLSTLAMYDLGMTQLLEKAFKEVQQLSDDEQNALAERILLELDEQRWTELFATPESQAWLEEMGAKALAEHWQSKNETRVSTPDLVLPKSPICSTQ